MKLDYREVTTRKPHECNLCPDPIGVGRRASVATYLHSTRGPVRWYAHRECYELAMGEWQNDQSGDWDREAEPNRGWIPDYIGCWRSDDPIIVEAIERTEPDDAARVRFARWFEDGREPGGVPIEGAGVQALLFGAA